MPFRCKACYSFTSYDFLDVYKHALDCPHGVACPICDDSLWDSDDLRQHMQEYHSKFECCQCQKRFYLRKALEDHQDATGHSARNNLDNFIEDQVRPTAQEMRELGQTVDEIVQFLHELGTFFPNKDYRISKVLKSGSLGKGTAVQNKMDVDLVVFMQAYSDMDAFLSDLPMILRDLAKYVKTHGRLQLWTKNRYMLKCKLGHFFVDILPAVDLLANDEPQDLFGEMAMQAGTSHDGPLSHYSACLAQLQKDFVLEYTERESGIEDLVRLVKYWSKDQELPIKSYCLELICIKVYQEFGANCSFDAARLFTEVMEKLADMRNLRVNFNDNYRSRSYSRDWSVPFVMDPANPYNNTLPTSRRDRQEVASAASRTLQGRARNENFNFCPDV